MPRVFVYSDLHVDNPVNMSVLVSLSATDYVQDALIVAGDVSDSIDSLKALFDCLCRKFAVVCFVPGNHELWVRGNSHRDSIAKFHDVLTTCGSYGVKTDPCKLGDARDAVWLVPLFSWYREPEQGEDSLYLKKASEDREKILWSDEYFCRWSADVGSSPADYFLRLNLPALRRRYDAPIISFSHFLPRRELIFESMSLAQSLQQLDAVIPYHPADPLPCFNFSRVAGDFGLERQIRRLGSMIHIYGHQHRARDRVIDGLRYVSHCLGYPREHSPFDSALPTPKCVWGDQS